MVKRRKTAAGIMLLVASGLTGSVLGLAGGYVVYVMSPAVYESSATVQIARVTAASSKQDNPAPAKAPRDAAEPDATAASTWITDDTDDAAAPDPPRQVDERLFILSDAVLSKAVERGQLDRLPELQEVGLSTGPDPEHASATLRSSGALQVQRLAQASSGEIYRISFCSASPTACQDVVTAVATACQQVVSESSSSAGWNESLELLNAAAGNVTRRINELETQLDELLLPTDVADDGKTVISAAMEKLKRLRSEAEQRTEERLLIEKQIRRAEALIVEGAPAADILASIGHRAITGGSAGASPIKTQAAKDAAERQKKIAARKKLAEQVERELAPLQLELDRLLKTLGSGHPTVQGVLAKMSRIRAPLENLQPLEASPDANLEALATSSDDPNIGSDAEQVSLLLRILRAEKKRVLDELSDVSALVDLAAGEVARQENLLKEDKRIRGEIEREQAIGQQIAARLEQLSAASPVPTATMTVLIAARPGVQVAPNLVPQLTTGGFSGLLGGTLIGGLVLLISLTSGKDERES